MMKAVKKALDPKNNHESGQSCQHQRRSSGRRISYSCILRKKGKAKALPFLFRAMKCYENSADLERVCTYAEVCSAFWQRKNQF